jgi:hypothetical protein
VDQGAVLVHDAEREAGAWIALHGIVEPNGQLIPSVCPAAFRPLARHPMLGDGTYQSVSNHFWALDIVLRGAVQESAKMDAAAWKAYFDQPEAQLLASTTGRRLPPLDLIDSNVTPGLVRRFKHEGIKRSSWLHTRGHGRLDRRAKLTRSEVSTLIASFFTMLCNAHIETERDAVKQNETS